MRNRSTYTGYLSPEDLKALTDARGSAWIGVGRTWHCTRKKKICSAELGLIFLGPGSQPKTSVVEPEPELDIKLCILFDVLHLTFFSFTFYHKFDETCLLCKKERFFNTVICFEKLAFYGLDMGPEPEP
jgi:hypothetical protein